MCSQQTQHPCVPTIIPVCVLSSFNSLHSFPSHSLSLSLSLPLSLSCCSNQTHKHSLFLSLSVLCPMYHSHRLCIQRIQVYPPFPSGSISATYSWFLPCSVQRCACVQLGRLADLIGGKGEGRTVRAGRMRSLLQLLIQLA